jgi:hypothetical protein
VFLFYRGLPLGGAVVEDRLARIFDQSRNYLDDLVEDAPRDSAQKGEIADGLAVPMKSTIARTT